MCLLKQSRPHLQRHNSKEIADHNNISSIPFQGWEMKHEDTKPSGACTEKNNSRNLQIGVPNYPGSRPHKDEHLFG